MSNWLGINAEFKLDLNAACGQTTKEFAALRDLSHDDPLIGAKFGNCLINAQAVASTDYERTQDKYDQLVLGSTVLVAVLLLGAVFLWSFYRIVPAFERTIIGGSIIAIKGKRRVQNYGNGLKARIDEEVNRKS